jgi:hypothetical protein
LGDAVSLRVVCGGRGAHRGKATKPWDICTVDRNPNVGPPDVPLFDVVSPPSAKPRKQMGWRRPKFSVENGHLLQGFKMVDGESVQTGWWYGFACPAPGCRRISELSEADLAAIYADSSTFDIAARRLPTT